MKKYLIIIESGTTNYSAFSPDVPGCITTGGTVEETISNMKKALEFHLAEEARPPVAQGLEYHLQHGILKEEPLAPGDLVTELKIV
jgi:predicted RNase H-like HicB family nuclease